MPTVFDAAKYILSKTGPMTTMKLHKFLYYAQGWSLVWEESPLFEDKIEAWVYGPVIPTLFAYHRGQYKVCAADFYSASCDVFSDEQKETMDLVIEGLKDTPAYLLIEKTHSEKPWINARKGLKGDERGHREITHQAMSDYFATLLP